MSYQRDMIAGMTDYTGVPREDILEHFREWLARTTRMIERLKSYREKVNAQEALFENPREVVQFIDFFIDLFTRYSGDLQRLVSEMPEAITQAHIEIIEQLYSSSKHEERYTITFKQDWVHKSLPHEEVRPLLGDIYGKTRDLLIDYRDMSNLVPRLRVFLATEHHAPPPIPNVRSVEALPAFQLKPNMFGIGINLNHIFGKIRDWRQKRRSSQSK